MIKGINRQIIEVAETGNLYFERALLFVRPGTDDVENNRLKTEARKMMEKLSKPPKTKGFQRDTKRLGKMRRITTAIFWSCFGAAVFALTEYLFF